MCEEQRCCEAPRWGPYTKHVCAVPPSDRSSINPFLKSSMHLKKTLILGWYIETQHKHANEGFLTMLLQRLLMVVELTHCPKPPCFSRIYDAAGFVRVIVKEVFSNASAQHYSCV